jgi:membrane protein implicated in regulation of membrane protease activity
MDWERLVFAIFIFLLLCGAAIIVGIILSLLVHTTLGGFIVLIVLAVGSIWIIYRRLGD